MKAVVELLDYANQLGVLLYEEDSRSGERTAVYEVVRKELTSPYEIIREPTFALDSKRGAQKLIDDLWAIGLRPTRLQQEHHAIKPMQDHIDSLKMIVVKLLEDV